VSTLGAPQFESFHFEANNAIILNVAQKNMMTLHHDGAFLSDGFFICEFKV
jgi:hypothetical protein